MLITALVFMVAALGFLAFRTAISSEVFGADAVNIAIAHSPSTAAPERPLALTDIVTWDRVRSVFTLESRTRYAPLNFLHVNTIQAVVEHMPGGMTIALMLAAGIFAAWVTLSLVLAWQWLGSLRWALLSTALMVGAPAVIGASQTLFALSYPMLPLVLTAGLVCHAGYQRSGHPLLLAGLALAGIIAPWLREFGSALPVIVLACEAVSPKRSRTVIGLCLPLLVHALYPSLLPWLVGLNHGMVTSIIGLPHSQALSTRLNGRFLGLLLVQAPPSLWLAAVAGIGLMIRHHGLPALPLPVIGGWPSRIRGRRWAMVFAVTALALLVTVLGVSHDETLWRGVSFRAPLPLLLASLGSLLLVLAATLRLGAQLPMMFAATFVPFLGLALGEVHLSVVVPALMPMLAAGIREVWQRMTLPAGRALLAGLLVLGVADQAANLRAARLVQGAIVQTHRQLAGWLVDNTRRGDVVVANFYDHADIFLLSGYWFDPYDTNGSSPLGAERAVDTPERTAALIRRAAGRDTYVLAESHAIYPYQAAYQPHRWLKDPPGRLEPLTETHLRVSYPYLDPLKLLLPRRFVSFAGYPDWETDFYFDNAGPFRRVVEARYTVYRLAPTGKAE